MFEQTCKICSLVIFDAGHLCDILWMQLKSAVCNSEERRFSIFWSISSHFFISSHTTLPQIIFCHTSHNAL